MARPRGTYIDDWPEGGGVTHRRRLRKKRLGRTSGRRIESRAESSSHGTWPGILTTDVKVRPSGHNSHGQQGLEPGGSADTTVPADLLSSPRVLNHPEQYLETLRRVDFFRSLSDDELTAIGRLMTKCELEVGQILFNEGDPCEGLYVVETGAIKIFTTSISGREQVLTIESAGGIVAELPVFDEGPYPASCQAVEDSLLLFLSKGDFRAICLESPPFALKVLATVGQRLRRLVGLIEDLSFTTVRQRLAALLVRKAEADGEESSRGLRLTLPANHEIGAEIGTVRELVSRNLSRFQAEGLIAMEGKAVYILDLEGLRTEIEAS